MNLKFRWPPSCAMLSPRPVTKLSRPMTLWPRARCRSVRCGPRQAAGPETTEGGFDRLEVRLKLVRIIGIAHFSLKFLEALSMPRSGGFWPSKPQDGGDNSQQCQSRAGQSDAQPQKGWLVVQNQRLLSGRHADLREKRFACLKCDLS